VEKGVCGDGGTPVINNNNKALCFVRMRWDETSAAKCIEDRNPPLMTLLASHSQQASALQADSLAGTRAVITGGEPPYKSYQMKPVGPTVWRQQLRNVSVHFRKILTIFVITTIIIVMMAVVEMAD
jgi:hypothetical protein